MTAKAVPVHYLKTNEREWSPPHVVFFDTETRPIPGSEPEINTLVLWCATAVLRRNTNNYKPREISGNGTDGSGFTQWLDSACKGIKSTWCYAHNLSFDITTTNAIKNLQAIGWELTDRFSTDDHSPYFRFKKGTRRLVFVDSWSWLPEALKTIGEAVRIKKPPLPEVTEWEALLYRCTEDVRILQTAILSLMDWWDNEDLGNWAITGASCGWSAFRHKMQARSIVIDPDSEGLEHDRTAIYGGRRDVWRIGTFQSGPYMELDFKDAHPTLAKEVPLPKQRYPLREGEKIRSKYLCHEELGYIARCIVTTEVPRYPFHIRGHVFYPTGTFETYLSGPELSMAEQRGDLLRILDGRAHRLAPYMGEWATWILDLTSGNLPGQPQVAKIAARSWGRSVIGKFAARTSTLVGKRESEYGGYKVIHGYDIPHDSRATWVMINGTEYAFIKDQWGQNAYPAVWAWIESHLRVRLSTVIEALPVGAIISCNTDGIIVDAKRLDTPIWRKQAGIRRNTSTTRAIQLWCDWISKQTAPLQLRVKASYDAVNVFGPSQMDLDDTMRWSGVSKGAERLEQFTFKVRDWPKMGYQLANNAQQGYLRPQRIIKQEGPFAPRWVRPDGSLQPLECQYSPESGTRVLGHPDRHLDRLGGMVAALQNPALRGLV